jgi:hypothetical protein|tara:strand:- start:982 stop:1257 length:276 start_codon:yes stop_codon:yes gene_type:complete
MGSRGQPKVSQFVEISITYKVKQYQKRFNETPYKAWVRLSRHRAFRDLMSDHYKNSKFRNYRVDQITENEETIKNFYKHHIKKWIPKIPVK